MLKRIDSKVGIEDGRSVGNEGGRKEQITLVKLKKWERKREVMTKKRALYGSSERIRNNST